MKTSPKVHICNCQYLAINQNVTRVKINQIIKVFVLFVKKFTLVPSLSVSGVESADRIRLESILGVVEVGEAISGKKLFTRTLHQ